MLEDKISRKPDDTILDRFTLATKSAYLKLTGRRAEAKKLYDKSYKPQELEISTFAQPFQLGLGTNELDTFFDTLQDEDINKKQAFESDNAQIIELIWN